MPQNYQEPVTGTKWHRCSSISISNSYGSAPSINLMEDEIMLLAGTTEPIRLGSRHFGIEYNPTTIIALRNPVTDALTGKSITHAEVYNILYSLYRQSAE